MSSYLSLKPKSHIAWLVNHSSTCVPFEFDIEQEVQKRIPIEPSEGDINFASKVTGYAKGTIHQYVHRGEIPYSKRGRKLWFKKSELLEWMENRQYF